MSSARIVDYDFGSNVVCVHGSKKTGIEKMKLSDLQRADLVAQYFCEYSAARCCSEKATQTGLSSLGPTNSRMTEAKATAPGSASHDPFELGMALERIVSINKAKREATCVFRVANEVVVSLDKLIKNYPVAVCEFCLQ